MNKRSCIYYNNNLLSDLPEIGIFSRNVKVKGNNEEPIQKTRWERNKTTTTKNKNVREKLLCVREMSENFLSKTGYEACVTSLPIVESHVVYVV